MLQCSSGCLGRLTSKQRLWTRTSSKRWSKVETKLKRWLLIAAVIVVGLLYVNIQQNLTIAQQRTELVKQLQTLTASQMHEGKMIHDVDEQEKKFEEALKTCKSK
jgi:cell division protein FtsB